MGEGESRTGAKGQGAAGKGSPGHAGRGPGAGGKGGGGAPPGPLSIPTLLGQSLTATERKLADRHSPLTSTGQRLCWGVLTHGGCSVAGCTRAHQGLKGKADQLHYTVQMQLHRRGGPKAGPRLGAAEVGQRNAALRAEAAAKAMESGRGWPAPRPSSRYPAPGSARGDPMADRYQR